MEDDWALEGTQAEPEEPAEEEEAEPLKGYRLSCTLHSALDGRVPFYFRIFVVVFFFG